MPKKLPTDGPNWIQQRAIADHRYFTVKMENDISKLFQNEKFSLYYFSSCNF